MKPGAVQGVWKDESFTACALLEAVVEEVLAQDGGDWDAPYTGAAFGGDEAGAGVPVRPPGFDGDSAEPGRAHSAGFAGSVVGMIEAIGLTKQYGSKRAVDDLSFTVQPGLVTGFLGPNGSGKSTTMRLILGLDAPTAGTVTVAGRRYRDFPAPLHEVGALLEARSLHPGRTAYRHLLALAQTHGIPRSRVDELVDLVGLHDVANKRAGKFSLGMGQRLGIAVALLGDPQTLLLDEPVNGLDPEGIHWIRTLLRGLAAEGRTVFISSHLMSEMALTADHLIVIGRGHLVADMSVTDFLATASGQLVRVRAPRATELAALLSDPAVHVTSDGTGSLEVSGLSSDQIGEIAAANGIALHELTPLRASLEEAFMDFTREDVEYKPQVHA